MTEENIRKYKGALEAVLFTMGNSVEIRTLAEALEITEPELEDIAAALAKDYEEEDRGLRIIRLEEAYQLCTKKEYYDVLIRVAAHPKRPVLTETVLEVLSIIAYKQPVTKGEVERIRGVSSDYAVNRLVEFGLIEEAGRLNAPGRPILFKTSEEFLRLFGISSPDELPMPSEETLEKARIEALREAKAEGLEIDEDDFLEAFREDDAFGNAVPEGEAEEDEGPVTIET